MALTELIFGGKVRPVIGVVQFDCSVRETHDEEADITEHPVEDGGVISDHIVNLPETLTLNGLVTNTPIVYLASAFASSPIQGDISNPSDRVAAAYTELRRIKADGEILTAVTSLREYSDMAIQSLSTVRDAANGKVLNCTIKLKKVPTVRTLAVSLPSPLDVGDKNAANKGRKGKTTPNNKSQDNVSTLKQGVEGVKKLFSG